MELHTSLETFNPFQLPFQLIVYESKQMPQDYIAVSRPVTPVKVIAKIFAGCYSMYNPVASPGYGRAVSHYHFPYCEPNQSGQQ